MREKSENKKTMSAEETAQADSLTVNQFLQTLNGKISGLQFVTNVSQPVKITTAARPGQSPMSVETFRYAYNRPPLSTITTESFEDFFGPLEPLDARWTNGRQYCEQQLTECLVYKEDKGNGVFDVYALGLLELATPGQYSLVGMKTTGTTGKI